MVDVTFFIGRRHLCLVVERTGAKDEVGIQRERRNPMSVLLERMKRPALLSVPDSHCPIAARRIQHALPTLSAAAPSHNIDACSVSAERVL